MKNWKGRMRRKQCEVIIIGSLFIFSVAFFAHGGFLSLTHSLQLLHIFIHFIHGLNT